jgi:hypothetical protein
VVWTVAVVTGRKIVVLVVIMVPDGGRIDVTVKVAVTVVVPPWVGTNVANWVTVDVTVVRGIGG